MVLIFLPPCDSLPNTIQKRQEIVVTSFVAGSLDETVRPKRLDHPKLNFWARTRRLRPLTTVIMKGRLDWQMIDILACSLWFIYS